MEVATSAAVVAAAAAAAATTTTTAGTCVQSAPLEPAARLSSPNTPVCTRASASGSVSGVPTLPRTQGEAGGDGVARRASSGWRALWKVVVVACLLGVGQKCSFSGFWSGHACPATRTVDALCVFPACCSLVQQLSKASATSARRANGRGGGANSCRASPALQRWGWRWWLTSARTSSSNPARAADAAAAATVRTATTAFVCRRC